MASGKILVWGLLLSAALLFACAVAEVTQSESCDEEKNDARNCTVGEVRVQPCPEAKLGNACKIKRGDSVTISFDFTPGQASQTLSGRAYWSNSLMDLPLLGMETNACNFTECPIKAEVPHTYTYTLPISRFFPARSYDVKWKLWNDNNMECCFITPIKLMR